MIGLDLRWVLLLFVVKVGCVGVYHTLLLWCITQCYEGVPYSEHEVLLGRDEESLGSVRTAFWI